MPFALLFVGVILLIAAIQGTEKALGRQLYSDFTGQNSYLFWAVAIILIGAVGYVQELKKFSVAFMSLILVVLLLSEKGFFGSLFSEVKTSATSPLTLPADAPASSGSGGSSSGGGIGDIAASAATAFVDAGFF